MHGSKLVSLQLKRILEKIYYHIDTKIMLNKI